jgi:hypothetical protein
MWKEFRGLLLIGQRLGFPRLFRSHQRLFGLQNPFATCESSFGGVSEWAASQFFLTVYDSTGAVGADESIHHKWRVFRGLLLIGQRLGFSRLFMSHQGLLGLPNPIATCESCFGGYIWMGSESVFLDYLWVKRGCVGWRMHSSPVKRVSGAIFDSAASQFSWLFVSQQGLTNPFVTCEKSFEGYFWEGSDSVFLDCLWVTRGYLGCRIHSPPVKAVSGAIFEWAASKFSLTVYESTGAVGADESIRHMWKEFQGLLLIGQQCGFPRLFMSHQGLLGLPNPFATCESSFGGYIWMSSMSVFLDCLWVNRGCGGLRIHSSHVKRVSRGLLLNGQRPSFPRLFMSHQKLFGLPNPFLTCEKSVEGYFW